MASAVEICNRALGRIGVDQFIEDFDDPNARARACRLHYEPCRDETLEDFPWNFAQSVTALSLVADVEVPGWQYVYRYPAHCAKVHRVTDEAGNRAIRQNLTNVGIWNYDALLPQKVPFAVMADPSTDGARILVTDLPGAYAWYTKRITDPSQFSAQFRSALAWRIAAEVALTLRADTRLYVNARDQFLWAVSQAQVASLMEEQPDRYPTSPSITARY